MRTLPILTAALLMLSVAGCSKPLKVQMQPLPESLRQPCAALPDVPNPLVDPERAYWEAEVIRLYAVCGAKVRAVIEATG